MASCDTPVLIAGAGPVGLALAVELSLRGVECRWGLAGRLRAAAPLPVSWSQDVPFCTTFLGREITRFAGVLGPDRLVYTVDYPFVGNDGAVADCRAGAPGRLRVQSASYHF